MDISLTAIIIGGTCMLIPFGMMAIHIIYELRKEWNEHKDNWREWYRW